MDIRYFLHLIWQKKWLLIGISIMSAAAAFYFMSRLPDTFKANAILSTGIIEFKGAKLSQDNPFYQQFQVDNAFDNLKEGIQSRSSILLLTQSLLYHDLNLREGDQAFRTLASISEKPENEVLARFVNNIDPDKFPPGDSLDQNDKVLLARLAKSLDYDYESLRKNLEVQRIGKTDYLKIEFTSENRGLSYFAVKTFCRHILALDKSSQNSEENSTVNFYATLVREKKLELDTLTRKLNLYNANQNLVDLEEQAKSTVGQLRELELLREQYNKEIPALEANINNLNHYIKQTARINADNYASSIFLNEDVKQITEQIRRLNEAFVSGGRKDASLENQISKLRSERQKLINRVANNETKDADEVVKRNRDLLDKRLEKELALSTAEEGVQSLDKEINRLKSRQKSLVSNDAFVGNLQQQIEIVRKEYFDLVNKFQDAEQVSKKSESRLSLMEPAQMPDKAEPNHQVLVSAFSGASTGVLGVLFLFIVAFFDRSVSSSYKLEQATNLPVLGTLNQLNFRKSDLNQVFSNADNPAEETLFLESIRKIRFLTESSGGKTFLVTSLNPGEGKSFFMLALAYAFSLAQKRILLIDTNFRNNSLSGVGTIPEEMVPFEMGNYQPSNTAGKNPLPVSPGFLPTTMDVLPNFGSKQSPAEAMAGKDFVKLLFEYQQHYDYIFLEGPALNQYADSRELAQIADKIIGVFSAKSSIKHKDSDAVNYLKGLENKYLGSVLNKVNSSDSV